MSEMEQIDTARIEKALTDLIEHFDTVHIFVTRHEEGQLQATISANEGRGNWFARYGQIKTWLVHTDSMTCHEATK